MTDLPHDPYITAVCEALTAADLDPTERTWTSDAESRGTYCYLDAVVTLDPSNTRDLDHDDIPADAAWPHGLILLWAWHTGIEDGEPERGPVWEFAEVKDDGSNEYPTGLPVDGYASPAAVVDALRRVISREIGAGDFHNFGLAKWAGGTIGDSWEHADQLDALCNAWGDAEAATDTQAPSRQAPAGPYAARRVAEEIAATGAVSYLSVDGETELVQEPQR